MQAKSAAIASLELAILLSNSRIPVLLVNYFISFLLIASLFGLVLICFGDNNTIIIVTMFDYNRQHLVLL